MLRRRDAVIGVLSAAALVSDGALAAEALEGQPPLPAPLDTFRAIGLKGGDGQQTSLSALLGPPRATVLSFWATWCAPCAWEGARLARLRLKYPDAKLAIIGVNIDQDAPAERRAQFRQKAQMNYLQAEDGLELYKAMSGRPRLALPLAYVFDATGQPTAAFGRFFGERSLTALEQAIAKVAAA
jgi:thiol-disulfide isomerase/thioredoxin